MSYRGLELLYLANASVLITHEIESAYWREWELLHLPGEVQLFLFLNLGLVLLVLVGFRALVRGQRGGLWFSLGLAGAGVLAFSIHGFFLARGHPEFRLPTSYAILGVSFALSLVQGVSAWRFLSEASTE
jgi:hypothetical protein